MNKPSWQAEQAASLYNIGNWSDGYVSVADGGHLQVHPRRDERAVDLKALVDRLGDEGLELPVLVRFEDILRDRVDTLTGAFGSVCEELDYRGGYTAVYPIKVNQQRRVVETIVRHGGERVGLEAGSKPELMAVLGLANPGSVIVCNGYKDRAYIRRALIGQAVGHRVYIVVEKPGELQMVLDEAQRMGVEPLIGFRARLASIGKGKWQNTGGEKSKFGLSASQLLAGIDTLRAAGKLDCLRLVHFHLGSQVANLRDIRAGLREAARYYVELARAGAPLAVVDVGGGLGVDYEGTRSRSECSMNYSVREYALNIVRTIQEACREAELPEPGIISESGRALTAHHAVVITSVIDREGPEPGEPVQLPAEAHTVLQDLQALRDDTERGPLERLHDAAHWLGEAQALFTHGVIDLPARAAAERLYVQVCLGVQDQLDPDIRSHRETLDELREKLAEKYFCNLSFFQSLPDVWAIDQVFPILPVHRLEERPDIRATLCDLTCDSDGRIDHYVDRGGIENTLALHALKSGERYLLGFFMVGAYQEILGDMHNLFGDTNAVNLTLTEDGGYALSEAEHGDRADELLRYVHLAPDELTQTYRRKLAAADIDPATRDAWFAELQAGLSGYTYLS